MEHNKLIFSKVPTLRFAEYTDEWHIYALSDFVTRITRRNKNNESSLPLTISAQYGLVDQITFFNKTVASVDLSGYYLLYNGDFAYNKSYSNDYAWGAVKRLDKYEKGCLSSLYFVFRPTDKVDSDYLTHYFETNKWHKGISDIAGEGARNHGLLNMAVDDYFATKHYLPSLSEQKKIACFLNLITKRIEIQNKIISKYETLIKGLSYYIIKKFNGKAYKLGTLAEIYQPQTITKTDLPDNGKYPVYGANGIIGFYDRFNHKESQIMITCRGSTCGTVNLSTPYSWITGNSMVINIDEHTSIVDKKYLYYYLKTQSFNDLISGSGQPQIVRKPLVNLNVFLPEISQQIKLREIIDTFEKTLKNEKEMLSALQKQKAFLLQSMFI